MAGVAAASSGVRPPSAGCGSSAMPSGTSRTRLRISSPSPTGTARSLRPASRHAEPPSTIIGDSSSASYLGR